MIGNTTVTVHVFIRLCLLFIASTVCHVFRIVDGTFCQAALKGKIQLREQLPKYLGGEVQLGKPSMILKIMSTTL